MSEQPGATPETRLPSGDGGGRTDGGERGTRVVARDRAARRAGARRAGGAAAVRPRRRRASSAPSAPCPLAGLGAAATIASLAVGLCVFLAYATTSSVARRVGELRWDAAVSEGVEGMALGLGLGTAHRHRRLPRRRAAGARVRRLRRGDAVRRDLPAVGLVRVPGGARRDGRHRCAARPAGHAHDAARHAARGGGQRRARRVARARAAARHRGLGGRHRDRRVGAGDRLRARGGARRAAASRDAAAVGHRRARRRPHGDAAVLAHGRAARGLPRRGGGRRAHGRRRSRGVPRQLPDLDRAGARRRRARRSQAWRCSAATSVQPTSSGRGA